MNRYFSIQDRKLAHSAIALMDAVVVSVKRVTDIISEITSASQEQTSGIEQINQAITQMDEVTQQNAALVEQAAAAAQSMQDRAGNLLEAVSIFRLAQNATPTISLNTPSKSSPPVNQPTPKNGKVKKLGAAKSVAVSRQKASAGGEDWEEF